MPDGGTPEPAKKEPRPGLSLDRAVRPFAFFVERFYPDPFIFLVLLTIFAAVAALLVTGLGPIDVARAWGSGLSELMGFIAQMTIMLVIAHALALTRPVSRVINRVAALPRTSFQVYFLVALVTGVFALFSWAFCLVGGAILARATAIRAEERGIAVHYPLVVATAYSGFAIWHMGYSGSAPLFVATPDHPFESLMGVLPVSETIFSLANMVTAVVALIVIALICPLMHPRQGVSRPPLDKLAAADGEEIHGPEGGGTTTPGERLNRMRFFNLALGIGLVVYLVHWFATRGLALDLNIVIWTFMAALLLVCRSPQELVDLVGRSTRVAGPILLQYPFYAGLMGLLVGTGLVALISQFFADVATAETLGFWTFMAGGLVNTFIPSGGGQWVVQGPMFLQAAAELGVHPSRIVMGVAYGDQWTNLIQPFWTLPLLSIAGLGIRDILGYCFLVLIALFFVFGGSLLLTGAG